MGNSWEFAEQKCGLNGGLIRIFNGIPLELLENQKVWEHVWEKIQKHVQLKKGDNLKIGWKVNITGKNRVKLGEVGGNDVKTWAEMGRATDWW